ncbi:MAG TPA: hypothetical protein PKJ19_14305 [Flavobacteriales bacterium]|nr:hypothetical protein [Flavobacteriales bacterium]
MRTMFPPLLALLVACGTQSTPTAVESTQYDLSTPDGLARLLFKALQEGRKETWTAHVHPESDCAENVGPHFERVRETLQSRGLTDWSSAEYSRVMYQTGGMVKEGSASYPKIEFEYERAKFIGHVKFWAFRKLPDGNYAIWCTMPEAELRRAKGVE